MDVALNAKFNLKAVQYDTQWDTSSSVDKDEPMDHSHAKEEADLRHAKKKLIFKLLSNIATSADAICAEALSTCARRARYASSARLL